MKKIGILYGIESAFPNALLENINKRKAPGVKAEFIKIGATKIEDLLGYNVILDRVSHEVPFYNSILKMAVLEGIRVINNPFWSYADDSFFHNVIATRLNLNVPKTVILPTKEHPNGTTSETLRNLEYPINWLSAFDYVGFPAYIKPNGSHASHIFFKVYNQTEFFSAYDLTGNHVMLLQEAIEYEEFYRCYVIGKKLVKILSYDPAKPKHLRFNSKPKPIAEKIQGLLQEMSLKICYALGFDFNVVEFAVLNGIPYAVEFMNTAPTADKAYLHDEHYNWLVEKTSDFLIEQARARKSKPGSYSWCNFLGAEKPKTVNLKKFLDS
jgi:hypothetical protein